MQSLWQDVRYGWRMLWQHRGVFALVSFALGTTALLAGLLPARAATKVNPIEVLRME